MALNYSHRQVFPSHISEDNLVSPVRIMNGYLMDGVPDKNGEGYARPWHVNREVEEQNFDGGRDRVDRCSSSESSSKDIIDLLPSDPFGMDIKTTFTAITGWLEDLEVDCGGYMRSNHGLASQEGYGLFAGWNLIWNNSLIFPPFPGTIQLDEKPNMGVQYLPSNLQVNEKPIIGNNYFLSRVQFHEKLNEASTLNTHREERGMETGLPPYGIRYQPACNMGDIVGFPNVSASCSSELQSKEEVEGAANYDAVPHEALVFSLGYLGVKSLLSVERVCRSLLSTIRGDAFLWMTIHIDRPLNERMTDDVLVQLASRAQGNLQCLSLVECPKVTDDGLRHILETNPRLTKLCVPGCTRINIEFIVNSIKAYNSNKDFGGIKLVRIGGIYGVNHEHIKELKLVLGAGNKIGGYNKPHFYQRGNCYIPYDDDREIDIEMCPKCEKFRLVYDCPAEGCKVKDRTPEACRGCTLCIPRCAQCGRCVNDTEFEETFSLEWLCSECFKQLPRQVG